MRDYDLIELQTEEEANLFSVGMGVLVGDDDDEEWFVERVTGAPELGFKVTVYRD